MYGVLKVRWEKGEAEDVRRLQITIPHNTTAEIRLEKGAEEIRTEGLDFALKEGIFTAQCGSGEWEIVYRKSF